MAGWLNEEKAAVNTCILDVTFSLSCKFLAEVGRVLIFDVFDDGVPATGSQSRYLSVALLTKAYHRSLLTWSPYPGVSTMLSLKRTPFSSMTINHKMLSICTFRTRRYYGLTYCERRFEFQL